MHTPARQSMPHVVIVGSGFGGLEAARALGNIPVRLTVIDRTNHFLFQPLLYQVAAAELAPSDISAAIRNILRRQRNTEVILGDVTGVDVENRRILLADGEVSYDMLVLATGAGQSYFGHPEWAEHAPGLKTWADGAEIRQKILLAFEAAERETDPRRQRTLMTIVVVGGGPTGVELAGALAELTHRALASDFRRIDPRNARIVLVEAMGRLLQPFSESLARKAYLELQRLGVYVRLNAPVEAVDENGVVIAGERLDAHTVIWAAGVSASPAGEWLGAETDKNGRVIVGPDLTVPGHSEIFVIGDTAHATQNGKPLPGVAPVAMQEGRYVARVIRARVEQRASPRPFHFFDRGYLATIGRSYAVGDIGPLHLSGLPAWMVWGGVHIAYLVGFRNRVLVMLQWIWAYLTVQHGARLISPGYGAKHPLRALLRR